MMKIYSHDLKKNKMILCGTFEGTTFYRMVTPRHFMRVVGGYGINEDAFGTLMEYGCKKVIIEDMTTHNAWESDIDDWLEHCTIADYGSGKQRFLGMKYMHTKKESIERD